MPWSVSKKGGYTHSASKQGKSHKKKKNSKKNSY